MHVDAEEILATDHSWFFGRVCATLNDEYVQHASRHAWRVCATLTKLQKHGWNKTPTALALNHFTHSFLHLSFLRYLNLYLPEN